MLTLQTHLDCFTLAFNDSVENLGLGVPWVGARDVQAPADGFGAYLGLVAPGIAMQLGVAATDRDCRILAHAMLGIEADDEPLPIQDVEDAMGEFVNVVAGRFKFHCAPQIDGLVLGLPLGVRGRIEAPRPSVGYERQAGIGACVVHLCAIWHDQAATSIKRAS